MDIEMKLDLNWKPIMLFGTIAAFLFLIYSIATMLVLIFIGGQPNEIIEIFTLFETNRFIALLRLDILAVIFMPFYYLIFFSLYGILKNTNKPVSQFWTFIVFVGVTLFLATPSAYSLISLSNKYVVVDDIATKNQLLAAGEALLASNMWNMTGAVVGGILIQVGALGISILMLKSAFWGKTIAIIGIITHSIDLLHFFVGFWNPPMGGIILAVAGTVYLIWFPMIGMKLLKMYRIIK